MLEQLFGSQTRVKLLQLFFSNPEEKYFIRELTRALNSQINAVRRELENLNDLGIIVVVESADDDKDAQRRKFYQTNVKYLIYPELSAIFQKSQFLLKKKFANSLKKAGKIDYLALAGFFVGDKSLPVDMLIVGKLKKTSFNRILKNFENNFRREINFTHLEPEEFNYRRSVADRFLYSILDAEKIVMIDTIMNAQEIDETE